MLANLFIVAALAQLSVQLRIPQVEFLAKPVVQLNLLSSLPYSTTPILDLQAKHWKDSYKLAIRAADFSTPSGDADGQAKERITSAVNEKLMLVSGRVHHVPGMHESTKGVKVPNPAPSRGKAAGQGASKQRGHKGSGKGGEKEKDASKCVTCSCGQFFTR